MASTIVGYFEDYSEARSAEQDLISAGFRDETKVVSQKVDGMELGQGTSAEPENWWDRMKAAFGVEDEHELGRYQEATRRGGTLVTVRVRDEQTSQVADILERHHPIDLDQKAESWQSDGKSTLTGQGVGQVVDAREKPATEVSIPLAEEELRVGKRAVQRGALRIHTFVTERPVEEQVSLREEEAYVDRHAVNRAADAGEAAFQERTIEVQELAEEAVVSKQARVVEEVTIGKDQKTRTETVRDTVRKTELEVDRDGTPVKR